MQVREKTNITSSSYIVENNSFLRKPSCTCLKVSCVFKKLFAIAIVSSVVWFSAGLIWGVTALAISSLIAIGITYYWSHRHVTEIPPKIDYKEHSKTNPSLKLNPQSNPTIEALE